MEERFIIRSVRLVVVVLLAVLCERTEQRPLCPLPADCGENTLGLGEDQPRSLKSIFLSAIEDPTAMKQLLETFLMQHNRFAEAGSFGNEDEENSTEGPPTETSFVDVEHQSKPFGAGNGYTSIEAEEESSTERPSAASSFADTGDEGPNYSSVIDEYATSTNADEENSTERPPIIADSLLDVVNQLKPTDESIVDKFTTTIRDTDDNESFSEITTVAPLQLASPLDTHEFYFQTTTIQPQRIRDPIQSENLAGQVDVATQTPVNSKKKNNTSVSSTTFSYVVNIPPIKSKKKTTKRTTTNRPQQSDTLTKRPETPSENQGKIRRKPTTKPDEKINSLMPVDQDQDVRGEIQLETLNRPISTRKPSATTATPVGESVSATSTRPNKKPINIIPETIVKKGQKPAAGIGKPQGSGIRNSTPNPVVPPPREPDDYLISALASIAGGGSNDGDGDGDDEDEDDDEDDEDEEEEDENSDESGEEVDEDEYATNSAEENEERDNFDYIDSRDASEVISSVMQEVGALI